MKASECKITDLLKDPCQYVVPSFQREYCWGEERRMVFIDGVIDAFRSDPEHEIFFGAIVIMPIAPTRTGLRKYLLIDGQQRMITMLALFAALRDAGREYSTSDPLPDIENRLFLNAGEKDSYLYKILPHPKNRAAFFQALGSGIYNGDNIFPAAESFLNRLHREKDLDLGLFYTFLLDHFMVVRIELERDENPYPIFRSLNMRDSSSSGDEINAYQHFGDDPELMAIIAGGESELLEFKEGLTTGASSDRKSDNHAKNLVRSVAAFMNNRNGGMLLLGVNDSGQLRGVNREYGQVDRGKANWDGFLLHLRNILRSRLTVDAPFRYYTISRRTVRRHDVCVITVRHASAPVYVDKRFYVRSGNQTIEMLGPDLVSYVHECWPEWSG